MYCIANPLDSVEPRALLSQGVAADPWPLKRSERVELQGSESVEAESKQLGDSHTIGSELSLEPRSKRGKSGDIAHDAFRCHDLLPAHGGSDHYTSRNDSDEALALVASLKDCTKQKDVSRGCKLHASVIGQGLLDKNIFIGNTLLNMYAKCGAIEKAQEVFDALPYPNTVSWNALISGYAQEDHGNEALDCYEQMQYEGFSPNAVTFVCTLKACGAIDAIDKGQYLHAQVLQEHLLEGNIILGNALVDMYAKCGALERAHNLVLDLLFWNVISWNALITGYVQHGYNDEALHCYEQMQLGGLLPSPVTFLCVLKACSSLRALEKGKDIHDLVTKQQLLESNSMLGSALVDMYAKCGALDKAQEVFDELQSQNVVVWNALIGGYVQHGQSVKALTCFERMQCTHISPNSVTFVCVLKACGGMGASERGEEIHAQLARSGLVKEDIHVGTALLDMYAKFGQLGKAEEVFDELRDRNSVSWNALVTGYLQHGQHEQALSCYDGMQADGFSPDATTFSSALKASGGIGAANKGRQIHSQMVRHGFLGTDLVVGTALVDMYANCGMLAEAQEVFDKLASNVVSWSALMEGYCQLGRDEAVFSLLERMSREGTRPNLVTFTIVLNTCSHSGLLEKGQAYMEAIHKSYGVVPTLDHYACLIDLFGRAGHVDKAVALVKEMPFFPNLTLWHTMLSACRSPGNSKLGQWAFEHASKLSGYDAAAFVCMNSILHAC